MPKRTTVSLHQDVIDKVLAIKPGRKSLTQFLEDCLDEYVDSSVTMGARPAGAGSLYGFNKEEEERAREELINVPPSPAPKTPKDPWSVKRVSPGLVPDDLLHVAELFVEWWAVRRKPAVRSEKVAYREFDKLRAWPSKDRAKALQKAIAGAWAQLYEQDDVRKSNTPQEAPSNHPAHKVFKADDLGPEWDVPSVTGGKGVLEGMF